LHRGWLVNIGRGAWKADSHFLSQKKMILINLLCSTFKI
jgi:hypothetical protein